MHKIYNAARAVNDSHPDFRTNLGWTDGKPWIESVIHQHRPHFLAVSRQFHQTRHAACNIFQLALDLRYLGTDRINVE